MLLETERASFADLGPLRRWPVFTAFLTLWSSNFLFDFLVQGRECVAAGHSHASAQTLPKPQRERLGDRLWRRGEKQAVSALFSKTAKQRSRFRHKFHSRAVHRGGVKSLLITVMAAIHGVLLGDRHFATSFPHPITCRYPNTPVGWVLLLPFPFDR